MDEWARQADDCFTLWFSLETLLAAFVTLRRFWAYNGPAYDWGFTLLLVLGFCLPGLLYLMYKLIAFFLYWRQRKRYTKAWKSLITPTWARRSALAFGIALLINLGIYPAVVSLWP